MRQGNPMGLLCGDDGAVCYTRPRSATAGPSEHHSDFNTQYIAWIISNRLLKLEVSAVVFEVPWS